jgi:SAM-dependent methyltransferase
VRGLDLQDKLVLDIGCAIGGFDVLLAKEHGARVIGLDVEAPLLELGRERVEKTGLSDRIDLRLEVSLPKSSECLSRAGGILTAGDWLRSDRPHNDVMHYFFELEGLIYPMDTLENYGAILRETGFVDVNLVDIHDEYQVLAHKEYERLQTTLSQTIFETLGQEQHDHFIENWRVLTLVVDAGDLRPGRLRASKPWL